MSELANPLSSWNTEHSPFASVIGTNHVPSTAELKSLQAHLVHPQLELSHLETEIDRAQTVLSNLLSEKRKIGNYIEAHRALASPVRQIPPETLAEIFVQCLPTEPSYPARNLNEAPLIFMTICRHWRSVALTTPLLWNSLHIFLPPHLSEDACSRRIAGTTMWLERSGSLPLSISFHGNTNLRHAWNPGQISHSERAMPETNMELMIRSLMLFSDRFRDVFLSLTSTSFTSFNKLSPSLFPSLISLRVRDEDSQFGTMWSSDDPAFSPLLSRMPLLKSLEIDEVLVPDKNFHLLPCNWRNITNIAIKDSLTPVKVIAILTETPWIQSISFLIALGDDMASTVVHLKDLVEMRLSVFQNQPVEDDALDGFFQTQVTSLTNCIQCSALRVLDFSSDWPTMAISKWPFSRLPLHSLEILNLAMPLTPNALTECLSQTPNLINFEFKTAMWPKFPLRDSHLSSLTFSPNNPNPMWPRLQNIRVLDQIYALEQSISSSATTSAKSLTNFLESRYQKTPLKSCDMLYQAKPDPYFSEAELSILQNLKQNGLKLRLHVQAKPPYGFTPDSPDTGIAHRFSPRHSDMEGHFGAEVII
ncbi:hypothetical protein BT96DRAFT_1020534 [Gymnopus androsaceus JB14]|uniref:Uncharacterized protein n=1 Tax=Gymnopus androsaceus JB14 TaxID=1447944 RepID=A0A6A4HLZ0_9AGAR|nr:hypothetical protein BT96DRAFT_1020534 [Gymnopus androsaceus JB14]